KYKIQYTRRIVSLAYSTAHRLCAISHRSRTLVKFERDNMNVSQFEQHANVTFYQNVETNLQS
ncbi:hypothetical protein L9F63_000925, partial [Diploptera punctata]